MARIKIYNNVDGTIRLDIEPNPDMYDLSKDDIVVLNNVSEGVDGCISISLFSVKNAIVLSVDSQTDVTVTRNESLIRPKSS